MKTLTLVATVSTLLLSAPTFATWSLGVGASFSPAVYKGTPSNKVVIPIIGYEGEHFYYRGFTAGYRLFERRSPHNVIFQLTYDPRSLDPSDSDNDFIKQLDKRRATGLGGVSYQYTTRYYGQFELTFAGDLFGQHDGLYAESAYRYPLRGERWMFTPTIGYAWNSSKLNNHLYGVSSSEAARTNVDTFNPDGDAEFFIGARGLLKITQHISFSAGVRYTNLEGDLEKSPLLKKTDSTSFNLGLTYSF